MVPLSELLTVGGPLEAQNPKQLKYNIIEISLLTLLQDLLELSMYYRDDAFAQILRPEQVAPAL